MRGSIVQLAVLGVALVVTLAACEHTKRKLGEGKKTYGLGGYYQLCKDQPESAVCQKK